MSEVYRCVLIDDELLALAYLRTLCEAIPNIEVVRAYDNPVNLLHDLPELSVDFCISDIVMPSLTGLDLAMQLNLPVIFTTAHNEYAADAFDIDAVDYLRKPVQKERLEKAIEKVVQILRQRAAKPVVLNVNTSKGKMRLVSDQVVAVSSETIDRRDKLVTLSTGEEWIIKNMSFEQLLSLLPDEQFCRISKSEVIGFSFVTGYTGETVFTSFKAKNGNLRHFSLSDNYRKEFLEKLSRKFGT
ncbi:MAG TPA: response regulator transcription factor [Fluviicola sp.]|nr:response regulator transcription factor [Fluviicola sp.]